MKLLLFPHAPAPRPGIDISHQVVPGASRLNVEPIERARQWRDLLRAVDGVCDDGPRAA